MKKLLIRTSKTLRRSRVWFFFLLLILASGLLIFGVWAHDCHECGPVAGGSNGQPGNQPMVAMSTTPCVNGMAGTFPCRNVDLASFLPLSDIGGVAGTENANDIWGWTDALTGKEYALMGLSSGTSFIDISNPDHPLYLGKLPTHSVNSTWRSMKVYRDHAFIVSEAEGHGMQVFDLTQLRYATSLPVTFTETAHYDDFEKAHTLALNEKSGFAYVAGSRAGANTCGRGLHMVDVRNPASPTFAGCVVPEPPYAYTHETQCVTYHGRDKAYKGHEICFNSNNHPEAFGLGALVIVDVTNKSKPIQLSQTTYPGLGFAHQGWLTEDHKYFLFNDEIDEVFYEVNSTTRIFNVLDLDAPSVKDLYRGPSTAMDHNLYIRGDYAYEGNYRSGLRMLNLRNVSSCCLTEDAFFDIFPIDDLPKFGGAWSNYPFFKSGIVIVGGMEQGLFVLRPSLPTNAALTARSTIFADDFENDPSSRWTVSRELTDPSTFVPRDWTWVHTLPDGRAGSAFFAPDPEAFELCSEPLPGQIGVLLLESPSVTLPNDIRGGPRLSFDHWVALELGFDGGQLMISVNGAPYELVDPDFVFNDADFIFNAYNWVLFPFEHNNPRFGQPAWSGVGGGLRNNTWGTTVVDLSRYAQPGDTIRLRWDMSTDFCFGTDAGWYVDNVKVYACFADRDGDGVADRDN